MGFSRQEYWSGLPFPSPGDLPNPGIEPLSPALQADILTSEPPGEAQLVFKGGGIQVQIHLFMQAFFSYFVFSVLCMMSRT